MELKPIRKATRLPLVSELRGCHLTRFGQQALLDEARVVSEGMVEEADDRGPVYHGSTLVTVSLDREDLSPLLRSPGAERVAGIARRSIGLHVRLMRLARAEAERRAAPRLPRAMRVEMEFSVDGPRLLVDIAVECPLAEPALEAAGGAGIER
jgi:hypothetical protein